MLINLFQSVMFNFYLPCPLCCRRGTYFNDVMLLGEAKVIYFSYIYIYVYHLYVAYMIYKYFYYVYEQL